jgi:hypothetical protein
MCEKWRFEKVESGHSGKLHRQPFQEKASVRKGRQPDDLSDPTDSPFLAQS